MKCTLAGGRMIMTSPLHGNIKIIIQDLYHYNFHFTKKKGGGCLRKGIIFTPPPFRMLTTSLRRNHGLGKPVKKFPVSTAASTILS